MKKSKHDRLRGYEYEKQLIIARNLPCREYEAAIRELARRLGV